MRKLSLFLQFDFGKFIGSKKCIITNVKFNEKRGCVSLEITIVEDNTDYGDASISNLYEKFQFHCINDTNPEDINKYPIHKNVVFKTFNKAVVYGEYMNMLSVSGEAMVVK